MGTQPPANIISAAQAAMQATGIPASVQLAQWALESGWGAHMPHGSNNPFGIKAVEGQPSVEVPTREVINGDWVTINAGFRAFPSLSDAFAAHADLLASRPQYAPARACLPDVAAFCNALTGVYATDPTYGRLLNEIIADSNLTAYDAPLAQTENT